MEDRIPNGIITLITDFGTADGYAGAMKGVIWGINPRARIVDITHDIRPQNIPHAAHVLETIHPYYPPGTIHVIVVDPGVGTERRAVAVRTPQAYLIAPDNGLLHPVIKDVIEAVALTERRFWREPVSATFHGRDIFAPVAACLSQGAPLGEFGPAISSLKSLSMPRPAVERDEVLVGHVIHIDRFGNAITDLEPGDLPPGPFRIEVKGRRIEGLSRTYAEGEGLLALVGSNGRVEIALKNGSAAEALRLVIGDRVEIRAT